MIEPVCVVLAAGQGVRFGGPKVLAPFREGGETIPLAVLHHRLRRADCAKTFLVMRAHHASALEALGHGLGESVVVSSEPDDVGPAGSLAAALAVVMPDHAAWWLVTPVDVPPASPPVVRALVDAVVRDPSVLAARPVCAGRGGHPVLVRASVLAAAMRDGARPSLRDILRSLGTARLDVAIEDPETLVDFDRREDLDAYLAARKDDSRA